MKLTAMSSQISLLGKGYYDEHPEQAQPADRKQYEH
jgi:hypothetical protein